MPWKACWYNNGKENGSNYGILGNIGIMEKKMETIMVYWGLLNCIHLLQIDGVEEFVEVSRDPGQGPRMKPSVLDRESVQVEKLPKSDSWSLLQ